VIQEVRAMSERIRTEQPIKNTIHNLIQTLSVKLDSAARYGLYQEDAQKDGFEDCAAVFARLADSEMSQIRELVICLREHVGEATVDIR
jgi:rubrerythrin